MITQFFQVYIGDLRGCQKLRQSLIFNWISSIKMLCHQMIQNARSAIWHSTILKYDSHMDGPELPDLEIEKFKFQALSLMILFQSATKLDVVEGSKQV